MKNRLASSSVTRNVSRGLAGSRGVLRAVVLSGLLAVSSLVWFAGPALSQAGDGGETAALKARVQQLEEQLVDMQVVIGTLESMGRGGAAALPPSGVGIGASGIGGGGFGGGGADSARLDGMETQIRAMTAQIEQLSRDVRSLSGGAGPRGDAGGASRYDAPASGYAAGPSPAPALGGFGSTTITPNQGNGGDAIGGFIANNDWQNSQQVAAAAPGGVDPKILYETAYGYLLQQDYGAAETSFGEFLQRYPQDELAGNAQYWLGESHYVRGQYKTAAEAFLKGYKTYRNGSKASDSLLKLAMSLEKLGQRDAACSSLAELTARFPDAPAHVKNRAASERARAGC